MQINKTSINWCFTINNPQQQDEVEIERLKPLCRYLIIGKEVGAHGIPHFQGFCVLLKLSRGSAVKKILSRAHIEAARGSCLQASVYCKKDGSFVEYGVLPKTKSEVASDRWKGVRKAAQEGRLEDVPESVYVQCYNQLKRIQKDYMPRPLDLTAVCGEWYYGCSGTGKTTKARTDHPGAYLKSRDHWWDGYQGEDVVILDDLDKYHVRLGGLLKDWADKWTFKAEEKGGYKWIRPKLFIVTSQYRIDDIFDDPKTVEALERRYHMRYFDKSF